MVVELPLIRRFAEVLHTKGDAWSAEAFGWLAEYNPERLEPPLDSEMTFSPAEFCIGETASGSSR